MGAANLRMSVQVIASLATFFGERQMVVRFYDSDEERLDLFDRFARVAFHSNKNRHALSSTTQANEALEGANRVILQVDENCARKELRARRGFQSSSTGSSLISEALEALLSDEVSSEAAVLNLQDNEVKIPLDSYYVIDWASQLRGEEYGVPHQLMRWIRSEEYLFDLFRANEQTPLKAWLNEPASALRICG